MSVTVGMTKAEREALAQLARRRERMAKTDAAQRSAELLAEFERQLATQYSFDDDAVWRSAHAEVQKVANEAQERIAERCQQLGIPGEFAPGLSIGWYSRGQNATRERRAELRKVAQTRISAMERAARSAIERQSLDIQTQLLAGGLVSKKARAFLESMPTAESLMPLLTVGEVETLRGGGLQRFPEVALNELVTAEEQR